MGRHPNRLLTEWLNEDPPKREVAAAAKVRHTDLDRILRDVQPQRTMQTVP